MKHFSILIFFSYCFQFSDAQECSYFPADCPEEIENTKDSLQCIRDFIVPQEISMQNRLREFLTNHMQEIADAKNWEMYEFNEWAPGESVLESIVVALPYHLRRPHQYIISFIFIVNQDSLKAWRDWYNHDLVDDANKMAENYSQRANDAEYQNYQKTCMDSANFWTGLMATYITTHAEVYQKALAKEDKFQIRKYEDSTSLYNNRANSWITKAQENIKASFSHTNKDFEKFSSETHTRKINFRNSTMIRIKFDFNSPVSSASGTGELKLTKQLNLPGTFSTLQIHNSTPYEKDIFDLDQFGRSTDFTYILFGRWQAGRTPWETNHAVFSLDRKNMDHITEKKTGSDKVQTLAAHIEGSPYYLEEFLKNLDTLKLEQLINL